MMCNLGDQVEVLIDGESVAIDHCIAPLVAWVASQGWQPTSSCCGHGDNDGYILCKDRLTILAQERTPDAVRARYLVDHDQMSYHHQYLRMRQAVQERDQ